MKKVYLPARSNQVKLNGSTIGLCIKAKKGIMVANNSAGEAFFIKTNATMIANAVTAQDPTVTEIASGECVAVYEFENFGTLKDMIITKNVADAIDLHFVVFKKNAFNMTDKVLDTDLDDKGISKSMDKLGRVKYLKFDETDKNLVARLITIPVTDKTFRPTNLEEFFDIREIADNEDQWIYMVIEFKTAIAPADVAPENPTFQIALELVPDHLLED